MNGALPDLSPLDLETDPKGCCARLYESDAVRWLLDDQLHPGGEPLTLRLAELAGVSSGARVVDVASAAGVTALLLARQFGCEAVGVDLGARAIAQARRAAGAGERVSFLVGDAEAMPLPDAGFDVALSECSLCTFPDKPRAIAEMARVVRAGGRIALADVTADLDAPPRRAAHRGRARRMRGRRPRRRRVRRAAARRRLRAARFEAHDAELRAMADRVEARLRVARMIAPPGEQRERIREAAMLARMAIEAIARGSLGYVLITARVSGLHPTG